MLAITPIYLAAAIVLYVFMSMYVIRSRYKFQISIGDGGKNRFQRIMRGHGNFAEYAPITLLAILAAELAGAPALLLHTAGVCLIVGRCLHGYCFLFTTTGMATRTAGMILTFSSMLIAAAGGLWAVLG